MLEGGFKDLIDKHAVRIVHPDPNTEGGILETKRIGDYAAQNRVAFMHHAVDHPEWEDLVTGIEKPIVQDGYVNVPEAPGLGLELNEDVAKKYLIEGEELFAPTPEWNEVRSWS